MLATSHVAVDSDPQYLAFEKLIAKRVATATGPLFMTNAEGLFEAYLAGIQPNARQHYTCHCCRRFITNYAGLVTIGKDGATEPALLDTADVPDFFAASVAGMRQLAKKAKVTGVFVNGLKVWGNPQTGVWTHLSGKPPAVHQSVLKNASQVSAEKREDYITLRKGLEDYSLDAAVQAVRVLQADAVDRSEKTLGVAEWLLALHRSIENVRGSARDNIIWAAVATAPPGWCHIRSTMISTLLDDIIAGLPFESIKTRWDAKMHPLRYQRPTTVKEGNLEQANKIVAKLQIEGALARRFARLDDIVAVWKPSVIDAPPAKRGGGAFDHLKAKTGTVKPVELPAAKIAWDKFRETGLPTAAEIEVYIGQGRLPFVGMVTAVNADAPPIMQWDGLEGLPRNPVSWYFYHGGSTPADWSLVSNAWTKATAICLKPPQWHSDKFVHQGKDVFFVLEGAKDLRHSSGGGFFPENLRTEYHEIRHAMEAFARNAAIAGRNEGNANGIALHGDSLTIRVTSKTGDRQTYSLTE